MIYELNLNGLPVSFQASPHDLLADVLRRSGRKSVKHGCDSSSCGICTVLMDDRPVLSCTVFIAQAAGHRITTAEGLQDEIAAFAACLTDEGAEQCGYCSPGLAISVIAMRREGTPADDESIRRYLAGNLCRCSGYAGQLRAIRRYMGVTA